MANLRCLRNFIFFTLRNFYTLSILRNFSNKHNLNNKHISDLLMAIRQVVSSLGRLKIKVRIERFPSAEAVEHAEPVLKQTYFSKKFDLVREKTLTYKDNSQNFFNIDGRRLIPGTSAPKELHSFSEIKLITVSKIHRDGQNIISFFHPIKPKEVKVVHVEESEEEEEEKEEMEF